MFSKGVFYFYVNRISKTIGLSLYFSSVITLMTSSIWSYKATQSLFISSPLRWNIYKFFINYIHGNDSLHVGEGLKGQLVSSIWQHQLLVLGKVFCPWAQSLLLVNSIFTRRIIIYFWCSNTVIIWDTWIIYQLFPDKHNLRGRSMWRR